jgi:hypothetical protein
MTLLEEVILWLLLLCHDLHLRNSFRVSIIAHKEVNTALMEVYVHDQRVAFFSWTAVEPSSCCFFINTE